MQLATGARPSLRTSFRLPLQPSCLSSRLARQSHTSTIQHTAAMSATPPTKVSGSPVVALPQTMQVLRYHKMGTLDELQLETMPVPSPESLQPGTALVKIHASGVNMVSSGRGVRRGAYWDDCDCNSEGTAATRNSGGELGEGVSPEARQSCYDTNVCAPFAICCVSRT